MKSIILLILVHGLSSPSYIQKIDSTLVGDWSLIESMVDPGDGSGTYRKVESKKSLKISTNGKVESNGNICNLSYATDEMTFGQLERIKDENVLTSCDENFKIYYVLKDDYLFVYYPCKEGCAEKYERKE